STMTVQAPQSPTSHPSLAPVRLKFSRSSLSSVVSGATEAERCSPLTVRVTETISVPCLSLLLRQFPGALERALGEDGNQIATIACRRPEIVNRLRVVDGKLAGFE